MSDFEDFDDIEITEITDEPADDDLIIKIGEDANKPGKKGERRRLYAILAVCFALVAVIAGGIFAVRFIKQKKAEAQLQAMAEATEVEDEPVAKPEEPADSMDLITIVSGNDTEDDPLLNLPGIEGFDVPEKSLDFEELKKQNDDIYAWITIPDTKVDYPILQSKDDQNYYLDHNMDGSTGLPGCIYTQDYNTKEFTDRNTVVYGHNMKNGTMFAGLHKFKDPEYFDSHRYIYVFTEDHINVFEIFAAYEFTDDHLLYDKDLSRDSVFEDYLSTVMDQKGKLGNVFKDGIDPDKDSRLITLETCISTKPDKRFLVAGILVARQ